MPKLYHGTSRAHATAMCGSPNHGGTINVWQGGGEFGRRFYAQSSISNAHRRGYLTYGGQNGAVLVLDIDDVPFHALRFWRLTLNRAQQLNAQLTGVARSSFVTSDDVIIGPLVAFPHIEQQKFQTQNAQNLLNGPETQRSVV